MRPLSIQRVERGFRVAESSSQVELGALEGTRDYKNPERNPRAAYKSPSKTASNELHPQRARWIAELNIKQRL